MNYSIYVESTPNPEVMKFVSNRMIADKSIEIKNLREAKGISIAEELLKFPFVKSIYLSANFISISKISEVSWEDIAMQLRIFISDHLNSNIIKNYVFNFFFFAAGNKILFRMSLYPGEFGCNDKSVFGSPTLC